MPRSNCCLQRCQHAIDHFTEVSGKLFSSLCLLMMALQCLAIGLNFFAINAILFQEAALYCHASLLMLGIAYGLKNNAHVRVDIFYQRLKPEAKAWVNALGAVLFTLPLCVFIFFISLNFVGSSWIMTEISSEPGGIPAVFLLKTLIPAMALLLALQTLAELCKALISLDQQTVNEKDDAL